MISDWKGNEIKEGDEICFIQINIHRMEQILAFPFPAFGEFRQGASDEACWIPGEYFEVQKDDEGPLFIIQETASEGYTFVMKIRLDDTMFAPTKNSILTIKGVSDNKPIETAAH